MLLLMMLLVVLLVVVRCVEGGNSGGDSRTLQGFLPSSSAGARFRGGGRNWSTPLCSCVCAGWRLWCRGSRVAGHHQEK